MKKNINYSLIGFGGIARTHAMASYSSNLRLNMPFNLNLLKIVTRRKSDLFVPGSKFTEDLESVLNDSDIDFVDICTPNNSHSELVCKSIEAKKHIYCEKPLSNSYDESKKMLDKVESSNLLNASALVFRFMPSVKYLKYLIDNSRIGDIIQFKATMYHKSYLDPNKKGVWRTLPESGGGALLDLGVHAIDTIHFILDKTESVFCENDIYFKERTHVDEISNVKMNLKNGIKGEVEVSRIFAESDETLILTIYGTKGSMRINGNDAHHVQIYDYNTKSSINESVPNNFLGYYPNEKAGINPFIDGHMTSIVNFSNKIFTGEWDTCTPTFKEALEAELVVSKCYESSNNGKKIII